VRNLNLSLNEHKVVLCVGDFIITCLSGCFALWLWGLTRTEPFLFDLMAFGGWIPVASILWVLLAWTFDLYNLVIGIRASQFVQRLMGVSAICLLFYLALFFSSPRDILPRLPILYFIGISLIAGIAWRFNYAASLASNAFQQRLLIIGAGWAGRALAQALQEHGLTNFHVIGFVDDDLAGRKSTVLDVPVLGPIKDTLAIAKKNRVNTVVYSITHQLRVEIFKILLDCQATGICIIRMPTLYEALTERVPVQHIAKDWLLPTDLAGGQISLSYRIFVWVIDHLFCFLGGIFFIITYPLVATLIKIESHGPVFYVQTRLGQGGKPFQLTKYRSMIEDAEKPDSPQWASDDDPRITGIGKVLRRLRMDELPQIMNILRGDLHLIGPRPERPEFYAQLEQEIPFYSVRLSVKPGLTGWAQIKYRYGSSVEETLVKLQYDLYYIKNRSPFLDLKILFRTIWKILSLGGT
jgi:exopolysaccharide biosynthesis polyprenyl glycosylphosphotransferase